MSEMREVKEERDTRCDSSCSVDGIAPECMPDEELLYELADLFKVFGDPTRIRILYALSVEELCVQDIADRLSMTQSAISHQLRVLKQMSLVKFRRDG